MDELHQAVAPFLPASGGGMSGSAGSMGSGGGGLGLDVLRSRRTSRG